MLFFLFAKFLAVDRLLPSDLSLRSLPRIQQNEGVIYVLDYIYAIWTVLAHI